MSFVSTPHQHASLLEWQHHLAGLSSDDQRKPHIAMAIRRAKQIIKNHIDYKEEQDECQESKETP
jgi:hypothetical protein